MGDGLLGLVEALTLLYFERTVTVGCIAQAFRMVWCVPGKMRMAFREEDTL